MLMRACQSAIAGVEAAIIPQMEETGTLYYLSLRETGDVVEIEFLGDKVWSSEESDARGHAQIEAELREAVTALVDTVSKIQVDAAEMPAKVPPRSAILEAAEKWAEAHRAHGAATTKRKEAEMEEKAAHAKLVLEAFGWDTPRTEVIHLQNGATVTVEATAFRYRARLEEGPQKGT